MPANCRNWPKKRRIRLFTLPVSGPRKAFISDPNGIRNSDTAKGQATKGSMSESESKGSFASNGLFVTLDDLQYTFHPLQTPEDRPHLFTYHLTIHNQSDQFITILARKWILSYGNGETDVIEGDKVIGKTPEISPGKCFSYSSFHLIPSSAHVHGAFHGMDPTGAPVTVSIPAFDLTVPGDTACN